MPVQTSTPTRPRPLNSGHSHVQTKPPKSSHSPPRSPSASSGCFTSDQLLNELEQRIGSQRMGMWFAHTQLRIEGQTVEVLSDSPFVAKWIESHFADDLRSIAREVVGAQAEVEIKTAASPIATVSWSVSNDETGTAPSIRADRSPSRKKSARSGQKLTALRQFCDFVVGPTNRLAYSAACRLAEESDRGMSPLFIHGDCGVGKTHLLQAICSRYIEISDRPQHVRYVTGEQFTNEYITAIRSNTIDAFRNKIRKLDLLAIDDVHFLSNKVRTQTEFLYTLDAIDLSGARVVLASDNHPHHIKRFSQSLISRFISGMVVKIDPPDRATRIELIQRLAAARGMKINSTAIELIADNCLGSVRELEGSITKLSAYRAVLQSSTNGNGAHGGGGQTSRNGASEHGQMVTNTGSVVSGNQPLSQGGHASNDEIGVVLAEQLFREQSWSPAHAVRISNIVEAVCVRLGVCKADVIGSGRHRRVVLARGLIAYLGRELTTHSFPEIAQALGRSNHSTIHTADQRLRRQITTGEPFDFGTVEPALNLKELADQLRRSIIQRKS